MLEAEPSVRECFILSWSMGFMPWGYTGKQITDKWKLHFLGFYQ